MYNEGNTKINCMYNEGIGFDIVGRITSHLAVKHW